MVYRPLSAFLGVAACGLLLVARSNADWITDSGYPQLSQELGASLPTGAGITVLQSEANTGTVDNVSYMPQTSATTPFAGTGNYSGKTFTIDSTPGVYSGHADSVGSAFYSNGGSIAPGITEVHVLLADDFYRGLIASGGPDTFAGSIQNHSWIATTTGSDSSDNQVLRAFDFMVNRDGVFSCVPMNNGTAALPTFLANSYNAISVGLSDGQHSLGGSTADGNGRQKPDIVVNTSLTSYASPAVASAAAMLRQKIKASFTTADHPQVIKAILLAGASKANLPAWKRATTSVPYDSTFGAGELNVLNAYHILAAGEQAASVSAPVSATGWNYNIAQSGSVKRYFFSIPAGSMANTFSAALTWHRKVTRFAGNYTTALPNLTLKLYAASNLAISGAALDQSVSTLDNVQHLFLRNLPAGEYALEVGSNTNNVNYGIAWQAQTGTGPGIHVRIEDAGTIFLDLANLDPYVTYTLQQSPNLTDWTNATTILTSASTASTTASWQDPGASVMTPRFYRLQWTSIR
ncbi:MAG: hypothetical protein RL693_1728 [Verrucomicrobiota bacterium]|jgi:hypothetical protein